MQGNKNVVIGVLIAVIVVVIGIAVWNMPDKRTPGEKVGDAIGTLSDGQGLDDAARELKDRTPGQRLEDGVKDATDGNPQ
jgi:hypothetical protein